MSWVKEYVGLCIIEVNDGEPVAARGLAESSTPLSRDDVLNQLIILKFPLKILVEKLYALNFISGQILIFDLSFKPNTLSCCV